MRPKLAIAQCGHLVRGRSKSLQSPKNLEKGGHKESNGHGKSTVLFPCRLRCRFGADTTLGRPPLCSLVPLSDSLSFPTFSRFLLSTLLSPDPINSQPTSPPHSQWVGQRKRRPKIRPLSKVSASSKIVSTLPCRIDGAGRKWTSPSQ